MEPRLCAVTAPREPALGFRVTPLSNKYWRTLSWRCAAAGIALMVLGILVVERSPWDLVLRALGGLALGNATHYAWWAWRGRGGRHADPKPGSTADLGVSGVP